jgi:tRNA-(ms[2]io[6]A)-hydroxylase
MLCLRVPTDPAWVKEALRDLGAVLVDHAHCEMKAASNALSLAARHPRNFALVKALTDLAKEEIEHFQRVAEVLEQRGLSLGAPPVDEYAADLRRAASTLGRWPTGPLLDRLLVGALIEARSCERFKLLLEALPAEEAELRALYTELFAAEARHYRTFLDLATRAEGSAERVNDRLDRLAELEAKIVSSDRAAKATIHG